MRALVLAATLAAAALAGLASPAEAQRRRECGPGPSFAEWLERTKAEAASRGISRRTIAATLDGLTYDPKVIGLDRGQRKAFGLTFDQFIKNRVSSGRIAKGKQMLRVHAGTLARVEQRFGVPKELVVTLWGMETDYGAVTGKLPVIRSLATLTYDCRRSDFFRPHLFAALELVDKGDLTLDEMVGAWAGELGQTQFLPDNHLKYAVDFDGDGRRDLVRSVPDVLASTANLLASSGWKRGQPYHEGTPNFDVLREWNRSLVYRQAIVYFASLLEGGEPRRPAAR